ncbi:hypothetical protein EDB86DRAFT_2824830 [Lactarius hatsudake]|nr:hypothetical protein EDB86DRAFT_2833033 [Lactarius hatsudake]KAH9005713.1 hypothetical protein EDB86DRAFT_2824830 [Lactarius hatsudake]
MNPNKRKREQLPDIPRKRRRIVLNVGGLIDPACAKWTLILSLLRHSRRRPPRLFKKPTCPKTIHCADARSASAPERNNRSAYAFAGSRNGGQQPLAIVSGVELFVVGRNTCTFGYSAFAPGSDGFSLACGDVRSVPAETAVVQEMVFV